jgi:hypothetical protein
MGLNAQDFTPFGDRTPLQPTSKDVVAKFFQVTRSTTTTSNLVRLPADAAVIGIKVFGSSNSNSGTTATVTVNVSTNAGVISTGTVDVHANGATTASVQMSNLPNLLTLPLNGDLVISAAPGTFWSNTFDNGRGFVPLSVSLVKGKLCLKTFG